MKKMHLFCNAHLDVIWQWQTAEAVSAALSTFQVAADFCEEFDGFIFNHNEAILYRWVEEHDPVLFEKIRKLVKLGKWHIVGGWTLQPDCLMLSGESFVRQILRGRRYFKEKFDVEPETAVNFDSFGHTRGLVQILNQCGYKYYVFMRPEEDKLQLPDQVFKWVGYDEKTSVTGYRLNSTYCSNFGKAASLIEDYLKEQTDQEIAMRCWGIGDHGGGPSRQDLNDIKELTRKYAGQIEIIHSIPERYFEEKLNIHQPPEYKGELLSVFTGCYTSLVRLKQLHRKLENELFAAEKMISSAMLKKDIQIDLNELDKAFEALAVMQFHDVLPGSSVKKSEEEALTIGNYGLKIAAEMKDKAFFTLISDEKKAKDGEIPVFAFNPHPYELNEIIECEYMLADQNWEDTFTSAKAYADGAEVKSQIIKEDSNLNLDWRKKIAVQTVLKPMALTRIDLKPYIAEKLSCEITGRDFYLFKGSKYEAKLNLKTGLIDSYIVNGKNLLAKDSFRIEVYQDNIDPWMMHSNMFTDLAGSFTLMPDEKAAELAGVENPGFRAVNMIEDGEVLTRIEAFFEYRKSCAKVTYDFYKGDVGFAVNVILYNFEKEKMMKLAVNTDLESPEFIGQTAFGQKPLFHDGTENVSQKWIIAKRDNNSLIIVNDGTYGSSEKENVVFLNLLRSTAYCALPINNRPLQKHDRFLFRAEQGEREFNFFVYGNTDGNPVAVAEEKASVKNEKPYVLNAFPTGGEGNIQSALILSGGLRLDAFKPAEDKNGFIARVFNPFAEEKKGTLLAPPFGLKKVLSLSKFEVKTVRITKEAISEIKMLEN